MTDRLLSVDSDTKLPPASVRSAWQTEFIDPAVSSLVGPAVAAVAAPKTARYLAGTNSGNEASAIQAVLDAAGSDEIVRLYGTFAIASTVIVTKNLDASGAVFNYSGSTVAVQVGSTSAATPRKRIVLPRVNYSSKPGTGWTSGTVGVKVVNMYSCDQIVVPHIVGFEIGLLSYGENTQGTSYCNFFLGQLDNNKVNLWIGASSATNGWSNQNTYIGGRFSHNSSEGSNVSGVEQVRLENLTGSQSDPNNNTFVGCSFESPNVVEWTVNVDGGSSNLFLNCRWEHTGGGSKVRWGAGALRNFIIGGSQLETVNETHVSGSGLNGKLGGSVGRILVQNEPGLVMENNFGASAPIISFTAPGGVAGGANPTTAYVARFTANAWGGKRDTDAVDRIRIDAQNGRLYVGDGATGPTGYIGGSSSSLFVGGGVNLTFLTDNTQDIGTSAALRPRNIHVGGYVRTPGVVVPKAAQTLAANGAVTINATAGNPVITLQANATSSSITNPTDAQILTITFVQDATGGRTVVWPTTCKFAGASAPSDTTASRRTSVTFQYDSTATAWYELSRAVAVG